LEIPHTLPQKQLMPIHSPLYVSFNPNFISSSFEYIFDS
jgi:hypothetical protein